MIKSQISIEKRPWQSIQYFFVVFVNVTLNVKLLVKGAVEGEFIVVDVESSLKWKNNKNRVFIFCDVFKTAQLEVKKSCLLGHNIKKHLWQ